MKDILNKVSPVTRKLVIAVGVVVFVVTLGWVLWEDHKNASRPNTVNAAELRSIHTNPDSPPHIRKSPYDSIN